MIVTYDRRKAAKELADIEQGDMVRRIDHRGVGLVENVESGFAWVAWKDGRKDYLPLIGLRKIAPCGRDYDVRRKQ